MKFQLLMTTLKHTQSIEKYHLDQKSSNSVESSLISESITKQKESVQPSPTIPKESSVETILSEESEDDTDDNESDNEIKHDDNAYDPDYGRPIISRRKGKGKGKGLPIISSRRKERYHYLIIMLTMVMGKLERR